VLWTQIGLQNLIDLTKKQKPIMEIQEESIFLTAKRSLYELYESTNSEYKSIDDDFSEQIKKLFESMNKLNQMKIEDHQGHSERHEALANKLSSQICEIEGLKSTNLMLWKDFLANLDSAQKELNIEKTLSELEIVYDGIAETDAFIEVMTERIHSIELLSLNVIENMHETKEELKAIL
jgi:hypothetical protein